MRRIATSRERAEEIRALSSAVDKAQQFHDAFENSMAGSPYSAFVSHYSPEEIRGMKHIHLSPDGQSGMLVKDHGDGRLEGTALFNSSSERGRGQQILQHGIQNLGVNYLEAYGPKLPKLYEQHGFETTEKYPFDPAQAAPDWDYDRLGTPDYHIMHKKVAKTASAFQEIRAEDLSTEDGRRSRPVSSQEFQQLAGEGKRRYDNFRASQGSTAGLDQNWDSHVEDAYNLTRQPWGGATINAENGRHVASDDDSYALTVKEPGMDTVKVPHGASRQEFAAAMLAARKKFAPILNRQNAHLGIFRDEDTQAIDFDPVYVTPHHSDVETIGAYTRALGGAYHFKSGDGFWPPHVVPDTPTPKIDPNRAHNSSQQQQDSIEREIQVSPRPGQRNSIHNSVTIPDNKNKEAQVSHLQPKPPTSKSLGPQHFSKAVASQPLSSKLRFKVDSTDPDLTHINAYHNSKPVGRLSLFTTYDYTNNLPAGTIQDLHVHPSYRRKGVATQLTEYAKYLGHNVKHSPILTDDGAGFAEATPLY